MIRCNTCRMLTGGTLSCVSIYRMLFSNLIPDMSAFSWYHESIFQSSSNVTHVNVISLHLQNAHRWNIVLCLHLQNVILFFNFRYISILMMPWVYITKFEQCDTRKCNFFAPKFRSLSCWKLHVELSSSLLVIVRSMNYLLHLHEKFDIGFVAM